MSKRETKNYRAGNMTFCSYSHSSYPYDEFDGVYKEIELIKAYYKDKLDYNSEEIEKNMFLQELEELKDRYGFDENGNKIQFDEEEFDLYD